MSCLCSSSACSVLDLMLVQLFGMVGEAWSPMELFKEMQQRGLEPDVITHTALVSACKKSHQAEKAIWRRQFAGGDVVQSP